MKDEWRLGRGETRKERERVRERERERDGKRGRKACLQEMDLGLNLVSLPHFNNPSLSLYLSPTNTFILPFLAIILSIYMYLLLLFQKVGRGTAQ